jgi:hypothetical protein
VIETAGVMTLTDADGSLLSRPTETLSVAEAQMIRGAAKLLRQRRFRMLIRCDACFEDGRQDGMRGEITRSHIALECRCRHLTFNGETL